MDNSNTVQWISKIVRSFKKTPQTSEIEPQHQEIYFTPPVAEKNNAEESVAWSLRVAAAWSWRMILVTIAVTGVLYALLKIQIVVVPVFIALLLTVMLHPLFNLLNKKFYFPKGLSATISLIVGILLIFSIIYVATSQIVYGMNDLVSQATRGLNEAIGWITNFLQQYLHINEHEIQNYISKFNTEISRTVYGLTGKVYSNAVSLTSSVATIIAGMLLAFFTVFFFLKDGRSIWLWIVRLFPKNARVPVHEAAIRGWITLTSYVKAQIIIAAVDAICIGFGAYMIGVPLAIPLTLLVFLGSFIPIVGALFSGSIAVLVAFVNNGITNAIIMLAIILLVQQIEGNLLQPLIMSSTVSLHPLAVLLSVTVATYLMSIVGALFIIPVVAFTNTAVLYLHGYDKFPELKTKIDRPGGPPGLLDLTMHASLNRKQPSLKETIIETVHEHENDPPVFHEGNLTEEETQDLDDSSIPPIR